MSSLAQPSDDVADSSIANFAVRRLQLGESLYYKALENILTSERQRQLTSTSSQQAAASTSTAAAAAADIKTFDFSVCNPGLSTSHSLSLL